MTSENASETATSTSTSTSTTAAPVPKAAAASSARAQHKAPEQTAQMSVLGMDGTDLEMPLHVAPTTTAAVASTAGADDDRKMAAKQPPKSPGTASPKPVSPRRALQLKQNQQQQNASTNSNSNPNNVRTKSAKAASNRNWFGRIVWGGSSSADEIGETTNYTSLGSPSNALPVNSESAAASLPPPPPLEGSSSSNSGGGGGSNSMSSTATVEDQLRQDCSFFYQGIEDPIQQKRGAALQPLSSALDRVPRVLSSRDGAIFHAKYQRLNQSILVQADDLELATEEGGGGGDQRQQEMVDFSSEHTSRGGNISDIQNSSLCYEQDGRLLMRLPCDQMRLIMDHDLEPGILSVEQWRNVDADEIAPTTGQAVAISGPPLRYVMTVPDDLYRRVVAEISDQYTSPFYIPNAGEHADIRLALIVLFVFMVLLFIGTMDWEFE